MSDAPVFIVGAPRSGTTLLRNLLNRLPRLAICRETQFYRHVYSRRKAFGDLSVLANRRRVVREYLATERIARSSIPTAGLEARLMEEGTSYRALFGALLAHYAASEGKARWGEKTPQHALFTETLCEWYPGAVILHMVRDPREVVASLLRVPWASDSVITNAREWRRNNVAARQSSYRPQYLLIRYQDLAAQPEEELRRICVHLGEEYSPAMLAPSEQGMPLSSWSKHSTQAVTAGRIGKWQEQLTAGDAALIEWAVGRELEAFGFAPSSEVRPSSMTLARALGWAAIDAARRRIAYFPAVLYRVLRPTKIAKEEFWTYRRIREAGEGTNEGPRRL